MTELDLIRTGRKAVSAKLESSPEFTNIEAEYGRYLFMPFDVPRFEIGDNFLDWFFERSKPINKTKHDIAGPPHATGTFRSVDTGELFEPTWQQNTVREVKELFPEISEQLMELLPFISPPEYKIWSSTIEVFPHRDATPWLDAPCSFRIMLHDENPKQTLYLVDSPIGKSGSSRFLSLPQNVNVFGWNNYRAKHASVFNQKRKVLLIPQMGIMKIDPTRFKALLDRSAEKYSKHCHKGALTATYS